MTGDGKVTIDGIEFDFSFLDDPPIGLLIDYDDAGLLDDGGRLVFTGMAQAAKVLHVTISHATDQPIDFEWVRRLREADFSTLLNLVLNRQEEAKDEGARPTEDGSSTSTTSSEAPTDGVPETSDN